MLLKSDLWPDQPDNLNGLRTAGVALRSVPLGFYRPDKKGKFVFSPMRSQRAAWPFAEEFSVIDANGKLRPNLLCHSIPDPTNNYATLQLVNPTNPRTWRKTVHVHRNEFAEHKYYYTHKFIVGTVRGPGTKIVNSVTPDKQLAEKFFGPLNYVIVDLGYGRLVNVAAGRALRPGQMVAIAEMAPTEEQIDQIKQTPFYQAAIQRAKVPELSEEAFINLYCPYEVSMELPRHDGFEPPYRVAERLVGHRPMAPLFDGIADAISSRSFLERDPALYKAFAKLAATAAIESPTTEAIKKKILNGFISTFEILTLILPEINWLQDPIVDPIYFHSNLMKACSAAINRIEEGVASHDITLVPPASPEGLTRRLSSTFAAYARVVGKRFSGAFHSEQLFRVFKHLNTPQYERIHRVTRALKRESKRLESSLGKCSRPVQTLARLLYWAMKEAQALDVCRVLNDLATRLGSPDPSALLQQPEKEFEPELLGWLMSAYPDRLGYDAETIAEAITHANNLWNNDLTYSRNIVKALAAHSDSNPQIIKLKASPPDNRPQPTVLTEEELETALDLKNLISGAGRACLGAQEDFSKTFEFFRNMVEFNSIVLGRMTHLMTVCQETSVDADPENATRGVADIVYEFADSVIEELEHRHNSLALRFVNGVKGLRHSTSGKVYQTPSWVNGFQERFRELYTATPGDVKSIAFALGVHVGSEWTFLHECGHIHHHFKDILDSIGKNADYINCHINSKGDGGVEEAHILEAINAINKLLEHDRHGLLRNAVLDGVTAFAGLHKEFFASFQNPPFAAPRSFYTIWPLSPGLGRQDKRFHIRRFEM